MVRTVVALATRAEAALEVPLTGLGVQRRVIGHSALHLRGMWSNRSVKGGGGEVEEGSRTDAEEVNKVIAAWRAAIMRGPIAARGLLRLKWSKLDGITRIWGCSSSESVQSDWIKYCPTA